MDNRLNRDAMAAYKLAGIEGCSAGFGDTRDVDVVNPVPAANSVIAFGRFAE